ncbi:MAG: hypothetical protein ACE5G3_13540, partial [Gammaproteobacteria bacterium]
SIGPNHPEIRSDRYRRPRIATRVPNLPAGREALAPNRMGYVCPPLGETGGKFAGRETRRNIRCGGSSDAPYKLLSLNLFRSRGAARAEAGGSSCGRRESDVK